MRFNIDDYNGNTVMHCPEKWMADVFCEHLHKAGRCWSDGKSYDDRISWKRHDYKTCYNFQEGRYSYIDYYNRVGYTILSFDDFDWERQIDDTSPEPNGFEVFIAICQGNSIL